MRAATRHWRALGYVAAAGLWAATVAHTLAVVQVASPADLGAAAPGTADRDQLASWAEIFQFQRVEGGGLAVAMLGIGILAGVWRATLTHPPGRGSGRLSSGLVMVGATVNAVTQLAYLGAMDRVQPDEAAGWYDPVTQAMLIDAIGGAAVYLGSAGLVLLAVGVWGMGWVGPLMWGAARRSGILTVALALGLLALAVTGFLRSPAQDVLVLLVTGALGPLWTIDLSRAIDRPAPRAVGRGRS